MNSKRCWGSKHDAQIAYEEALDSGFRNSYSALWEKFDAVECDRHVYRLNVPLKLRPLQSVNRVHRARARDRRRNWDDIVQSARSRMIDYRMAEEARGLGGGGSSASPAAGPSVTTVDGSAGSAGRMTPAKAEKAASGLPCGSALASGEEENAGAAGSAIG